jgi:hypothetical protein
MGATANPKVPIFVALALTAVGLLLAAVAGWGSFLAVLVSALALIPGGYATWTGIQQKHQGYLAGAVVAILLAISVSGALLVIYVVKGGARLAQEHRLETVKPGQAEKN